MQKCSLKMIVYFVYFRYIHESYKIINHFNEMKIPKQDCGEDGGGSKEDQSGMEDNIKGTAEQDQSGDKVGPSSSRCSSSASNTSDKDGAKGNVR